MQTAEDFDIYLMHQFISSFLILQQMLFAYCYLGNMITITCPKVGMAMYHVNWYNFAPMPKYRYYIQMVIMRSQRDFIVTGHSLVPCTLANFKEVRVDLRIESSLHQLTDNCFHFFLFLHYVLVLLSPICIRRFWIWLHRPFSYCVASTNEQRRLRHHSSKLFGPFLTQRILSESIKCANGLNRHNKRS